MNSALSPLLEPRSICFIGASSDAGRIGGMPLSLLVRYGYQGKVYPVNPKYQEVFGMPCFPDVESLPEAVDLAVLAIAAKDVAPMLRRCHAKGVKGAIVYAAGFAEEGAAGQALQRELESFVRESGMVVAGPNCMGMANLNSQAHTAFASVFNAVPMQEERGRVSLLTQSGNVCAAVYALVRKVGLPVSHFINTGNEACVEFAQYLEYLADDKDTEIILGYVEQLRDGERFVRACEKLRERDKVLIALKAGSTEKGAAAVRSHTSALAGDEKVYRSVFEELQIIQANDFAQMAHLAYLAGLRHRSAGKRMAVITMSGALGAILADRFTEAGLELPDLPLDVQAALRKGIPDYGMVGNPVDVTGNIVNDPGFVHSALSALATSPALDAVVIYAPGYMLDRMADSIVSVAREHNRFFAAIDTGAAKCRDSLADAGVAVFDDLGRAVAALGPFLCWQERRKAAGNWCSLQADATEEVEEGKAESSPAQWTEATALRYLAGFGLPVKETRVARSTVEAMELAGEAGYPVVLKIVSPDIAHKTEAGGVVLGIQDEPQLVEAYERMLSDVNAYAPDARVEGVLVQRMEGHGIEVIVGAHRDYVFGPMVTVGLGGVLTEIYKDTAHALLPISSAKAAGLLRQLVAFPLLDGYRNTHKADVAAAAEAICAIGKAMVAAPQSVQAIEVNPLLVRKRGSGAVALDALVLAEEHVPPKQ